MGVRIQPVSDSGTTSSLGCAAYGPSLPHPVPLDPCLSQVSVLAKPGQHLLTFFWQHGAWKWLHWASTYPWAGSASSSITTLYGRFATLLCKPIPGLVVHPQPYMKLAISYFIPSCFRIHKWLLGVPSWSRAHSINESNVHKRNAYQDLNL